MAELEARSHRSRRRSPRPRSRSRSRSRSPARRQRDNNRNDSVRKDRHRPRSRDRDRERHRSWSSDRRRRRRSDERIDHGTRAHSSSSRRSKHRTRSSSRSRSPRRPVVRKALPSQAESFGQTDVRGRDADGPSAPPKQKPNFANTGLLAKEANTVAGTKTVLKYHEQKEARTPPASQQWQLFVFEGEDSLDPIPLYSRSCWLLGRESAVVDVELESAKADKQHAVIQFRYIPKKNEFGDLMDSVKPYLIDLESASGSTLNGRAVEASRYVELRGNDVLRFGGGEREYVLMLPSPD